VWKAGVFSNLWLLGAVATSFGLLLVVLYHPVLAAVFSASPLNGEQWALIVAASAIPAIFNYMATVVRGVIFPRVAVVKK
jgi:P-type Ca2+ transporter type 2C